MVVVEFPFVLIVNAVLLPKGSQVLEKHYGCLMYVAPEMLFPNVYLGKAADMWSVGILLYTLLAGHYPFSDFNPHALFLKIRSGHNIMPEHFSPLVRSLISSLLSYNPLQRPPARIIQEHPWMVGKPSRLFREYSPVGGPSCSHIITVPIDTHHTH